MQIKKYEGNYDRSEFYSLMGKFFAEPQYKKELPYLTNRDDTGRLSYVQKSNKPLEIIVAE